jgi:hypothetical protein
MGAPYQKIDGPSLSTPVGYNGRPHILTVPTPLSLTTRSIYRGFHTFASWTGVGIWDSTVRRRRAVDDFLRRPRARSARIEEVLGRRGEETPRFQNCN